MTYIILKLALMAFILLLLAVVVVVSSQFSTLWLRPMVCDFIGQLWTHHSQVLARTLGLLPCSGSPLFLVNSTQHRRPLSPRISCSLMPMPNCCPTQGSLCFQGNHLWPLSCARWVVGNRLGSHMEAVSSLKTEVDSYVFGVLPHTPGLAHGKSAS